MKTLIIDNYDSFTYNLYQYIGELGGNPIVKRNDEISISEIKKLKPSHIVFSPGPGRPEVERDFGVCKDILDKYDGKTPLLGVCLGHQGIIHHFGGEVINAPVVMHGKKSIVTHDNSRLFKDLPKSFEVMRYHSLIGSKKNFPQSLTITSQTKDDELIMAVEHKELPIFGIQFHPESIGTEEGKNILKNFLEVK